MDFSSILGGSSSKEEAEGHKATILKNSLNNGAYKVYQDPSGHVQRTEILVPGGKILIIKDYDKIPVFSHYRSLTVLSPDDVTRGTLSIVPEDRRIPNGMLRFYNGNMQIGSGTGDIGAAIAGKLLNFEADPRKLATAKVDDDIIAAITDFLKDK